MTQTAIPPASRAVTVLTFRLGPNLHALPIDRVEEVLPALPIEAISGCPRFIRGVVFVRGHLIPVLSGSERMGLSGHQRPPEPQIVCLRLEGRLVGLEIDEAVDLVEIDPGEIMPGSAVGVPQGLLRGLVERGGSIIRLIDVERLMDAAETAEFAQLASNA